MISRYHEFDCIYVYFNMGLLMYAYYAIVYLLHILSPQKRYTFNQWNATVRVDTANLPGNIYFCLQNSYLYMMTHIVV